MLCNHLSSQSCDEFLEEQDSVSPSYIVGVRNNGQHSRVIEKLTYVSFFYVTADSLEAKERYPFLGY